MKVLLVKTSIFLTSFLFIIFAVCKTNAANVPNRVKLDIPIIYQLDDYSCATTSLAMAISYFEKKIIDKNEVWRISGTSIYDVKNYGNDMNGLDKISLYYGCSSKFRENLSVSDLEKYIDNGFPILINILQPNQTSSTHAVLVVGYDRSKQILFINDRARSVIGDSISYDKLNKIWLAYIKKPKKDIYEMVYRSGYILGTKD